MIKLCTLNFASNFKSSPPTYIKFLKIFSQIRFNSQFVIHLQFKNCDRYCKLLQLFLRSYKVPSSYFHHTTNEDESHRTNLNFTAKIIINSTRYKITITSLKNQWYNGFSLKKKKQLLPVVKNRTCQSFCFFTVIINKSCFSS